MAQSAPFAPAGALRAFAYRALWGCAETLQRLANGCLYFSAGLLRPDDLRRASTTRWNTFTTTTDDVDAGLDGWERRIYQDTLTLSDRVLLVGCGAGRDLIALRVLGYEVTGLDVSPAITVLAREHLARRGLTAEVRTGFIEQADPGGPFDAIVFSGRCYGCIRGQATRQSTLARLTTRLTPSGRIIISYGIPVGDANFARRLTGLAASLTGAGWRPEPGDRFTCDYLAPRILRYEHLFQPDELAGELRGVGLRVVRDENIGSPFRCSIAVGNGHFKSVGAGFSRLNPPEGGSHV